MTAVTQSLRMSVFESISEKWWKTSQEHRLVSGGRRSGCQQWRNPLVPWKFGGGEVRLQPLWKMSVISPALLKLCCDWLPDSHGRAGVGTDWWSTLATPRRRLRLRHQACGAGWLDTILSHFHNVKPKPDINTFLEVSCFVENSMRP